MKSISFSMSAARIFMFSASCGVFSIASHTLAYRLPVILVPPSFLLNHLLESLLTEIKV